MPTNPEKSNSKKKQLNLYARFSAIGFQMAAFIFLLTWAGVKLDDFVQFKIPVFTLVLSLFSVVGAIWFLIKETGKMGNQGKEEE